MEDLTGRICMLWEFDYWDGPLSGYVKLDNRAGYWVELIDEDYVSKERIYMVYQLSEEQERIALVNHALFREHVGTHADYYEYKEIMQPESEWPKYYDAKKEMPAFQEEQIIGTTRSLWPK